MRIILFLVFILTQGAFAQPVKKEASDPSQGFRVTFVDGHRVVISDSPHPPPHSAFYPPRPEPDFTSLRLRPHPEGLRSYLMSQLPTPESRGDNHSDKPTIGCAEGAAFVGNTLYSIAQQKATAQEFPELVKKALIAGEEADRFKERSKWLEKKLELERSEESRSKSLRLADLVSQLNQRLEVPLTEKVVAASNRMIERKSREAEVRLNTQLREYETLDLVHEIRGWNVYSPEKRETLNQIYHFADQAIRLQEAGVAEEYKNVSRLTLQAGLNILTQAAQIAGGHREGVFAESLEAVKSLSEMGKSVLDIGLGLTPGVGFAKDCYEAISGISLIDGAELDSFARGFAVLGVVTVGGSNVVRGALKGLHGIANLMHAGRVGHGLESAIRVAESGIAQISRHTPISQGALHAVPIPGVDLARGLPRSELPMQMISDTFRSGTYIQYTTTMPTVLYRVASATPETAVGMKSIETTTAHFSGFWTRTMPISPTQVMIDSALERSWGSHANIWVEVQVPAGTTLYEGVSAGIQRMGHHMSHFVGGGNQVYLHGNIPREWVQRVGDFL
jgi:hypothetical protein